MYRYSTVCSAQQTNWNLKFVSKRGASINWSADDVIGKSRLQKVFVFSGSSFQLPGQSLECCQPSIYIYYIYAHSICADCKSRMRAWLATGHNKESSSSTRDCRRLCKLNAQCKLKEQEGVAGRCGYFLHCNDIKADLAGLQLNCFLTKKVCRLRFNFTLASRIISPFCAEATF